MRFSDQLALLWSKDPARLLCVGLDPDPAALPRKLLEQANLAEAVRTFCLGIIDAAAPFVCAFKPQIAHFAALGLEAVLQEVIAYIHANYPDLVVILDAKRGDIASTARFYAREAFERYKADAVTLNPLMGRDTLSPFWEDFPERGLFLLCRTSNPSACEVEDQLLANQTPLYLHLARLAAGAWNPTGQTGLVVGATAPIELARVRALAPGLPLLVPGIGAQGGDLEQVVAVGYGKRSMPALLINVSRSILYADRGREWQKAAGRAAQTYAQMIAEAVFRYSVAQEDENI